LPDWCVRLGLALALWAVAAPPALAAGPASATRPDETARSHHEQGRRQFGQGQYEGAIASYRKAYELKADPSYLLDIAEAYRALDVPERAVFFYNRYLSAHPNPPNRFEVEAEVARLKRRLPPEAVIAPAAPAAPAVVLDPAAEPRPAPGGPRSVGTTGSNLDLGLAARPVRDDQRPLVGRWWFWTAIGALAAAGATVAILSASSGDDEIPTTQLGHAKLF
jgi:tetratricopeptide (TPR) repeat protein